MRLGRSKDIMYMVQYTDPVYTVDGAVKTYHFPNIEEAMRKKEEMLHHRPDVTDLVVVRQETTWDRKKVG